MGLTALALALFLPALPAAADLLGIPNFHQVNETVFRGGQPPAESWQGLAKLGVKTVVDLRRTDEHSTEEEAKAVAAAGMKYVNVPMTGLTPPTEPEITRILGILEDDSAGAVFVHCQRGADRTGAVIAAYRIDHEHWDNARALSEAKSDGMGSFQFPRRSYIRDFQPRTVDAKTGSKATSATTAAPDAVTVSPQNAVSNSPVR